jgi:hypothetical protein
MLKNVVVTLVCTLVCTAYAIDIEDTPWTEATVGSLQALDRTAIEEFVNRVGGDELHHTSVGEFVWSDLAGDGQYALVVTADTTGRSFFDAVYIYRRNDQGTVEVQSIIGRGVHDLAKSIRQLNGDKRRELVIPSGLDAQGPGGAFSPTVVWPKVYRLRGGKYVEASRDFPQFYDNEVLPELEAAIGEARKKVGSQPDSELGSPTAGMSPKQEAEACFPRRRLASLEMAKDKILRVLGRDPTAGVSAARAWVANVDPCLVGDAVVVFRDVGGHGDDVRAAENAMSQRLKPSD